LEESVRALVVSEDHRLELRDIPQPKPGKFEALVKIKACGICSSTDSEIIRGTQPYHKGYPCLLGHEAIGEVISVGSGVKRFRPGDLVTRPVGIWPGTSRDGLISGWGGFAEFGIVRDKDAMANAGDASAADDYTALRQNVIPRGLTLSQAVGSIALAETLSWTRHLPDLQGSTVCVAGTGIAGLSIIFWCKFLGAKTVIVLGRRSERIGLSLGIGADHGVNIRERDSATAVKELTAGRGVDFFLEAAGQSDQLRVGCSLIRGGGTIAVYGVPSEGKYDLDWQWIPSDVRFLKPPAEEHLAYAEVANMILQHKIPIERLMSHQWPLAEFDAAFAAVHGGAVVKGMLVMPD
jgi:threonine dehydrogenase-like Zn-dependent dehydrogenase